MNTSIRLTRVPASPIRKLVPFAVSAKKQGVRVYHLNIGDPDIETPEVMINELTSWKRNPISYSQSQGEPVFLDALRSYYHHLGFDYIDTAHIQVTLGGSEAISWALFATCDIGDEVIVFEPLYANYNTYAVVNGVRLVPVRTTIEDGFHLPRPDVIERAITRRTRAILYCNPNNPTGTVYTQQEVETLVAIARKHNVFLLADEVYREFVFDGNKQVSILSYMKEIPKQAIMLDSLSKRYSLCGARLGALVCLNYDIMSGVLRIGQGRLSAGYIDQIVAAQLTKVPESYVRSVQREYEVRRDTLYKGLKQIPGVGVQKPEGAFYVIVKLPVDSAEKFCQWLLTDFRDNNETVMLAPASGFYATPDLGIDEVRIAYVLNRHAIIRCLELLKLALTQYNQ